MEQAGRWSLLGEPPAEAPAELAARTLLGRYGVVFRGLADRERLMPPWRDLVRVFRRLEARGEIRGGLFVAGVGGEQYALPEAVGELRSVRRAPRTGALVSVGAADPANLLDCMGVRVASRASGRVLYRDGTPVAVLEGGEVRFLESVPAAQQWSLHKVLLRDPSPGILAAYLR